MIAGSIPYTVIGTPEKDSGIRFVEAAELVEKMQNPKMRDAIDRIERHDFKGKPSAMKMLVRKQIVNDTIMRMRTEHQKSIIDRAAKAAS